MHDKEIVMKDLEQLQKDYPVIDFENLNMEDLLYEPEEIIERLKKKALSEKLESMQWDCEEENICLSNREEEWDFTEVRKQLENLNVAIY